MAYLLDTNLISELLKKQVDPAVEERLRLTPGDELFTSSVCIMELRYGAARHPQGRRLWARIQEQVLSRIAVVPLGAQEAVRAGELLAELEAAGITLGVEDVLIGATALARELTLVTRNVKHMARIKGLRLENWWS